MSTRYSILLSLFAAAFLFMTISAESKDASSASPDLAQLEKMSARFAPTPLRVDTSKLTSGEQGAALTDLAQVRLLKVFEFKLPLYALEAVQGDRVRLRFSLWRDRLPIDALPVEGWIELQLLPDEELRAAAY